jgi:hypothetical protein
MSGTDDNGFEQARADSEDWVAWDAQLDPALAVPAPETFLVDRPRLEQGLLAELTPEQRDDWNAGRLRYQFGGFDNEHGWGWVKVTDSRDGGRVLGIRCHWSAIAAR